MLSIKIVCAFNLLIPQKHIDARHECAQGMILGEKHKRPYATRIQCNKTAVSQYSPIYGAKIIYFA